MCNVHQTSVANMKTMQDVIAKVLEDHLDVLTDRIKQIWAVADEDIYTDHHIILRRFTPSVNMVRLGLDITGLGAFILEYGSGSFMVTNTSAELGDFGNPDLPEYMASSWYNDNRSSHGNAIMGRNQGETVHSPTMGVPDYKSKGHFKGINLEEPMKKSKLKPLEPKEPMFVVETEIVHWLKELDEAIDDAVSDYIETKLDNAFKGVIA